MHIHSVFYIKTLILLLSPVTWKTNCQLTFSISVLITASDTSVEASLITLSILKRLLTPLTICVSDSLDVAKLDRMSIVYPVLSLFCLNCTRAVSFKKRWNSNSWSLYSVNLVILYRIILKPCTVPAVTTSTKTFRGNRALCFR